MHGSLTGEPGTMTALQFLTQLVAKGRAVVPAEVTLAILQALAQAEQAAPGRLQGTEFTAQGACAARPSCKGAFERGQQGFKLAGGPQQTCQ